MAVLVLMKLYRPYLIIIFKYNIFWTCMLYHIRTAYYTDAGSLDSA